jgi:DnaJ-class molecular chaperone
MGAVDQNSELTDVSLCYQAMGIPLDAPPDQIERRYRSLAVEYKKKMASSDQALREEARLSLELLQEMYSKIQKSATYRAFHEESLKKRAASPVAETGSQRGVHQAVAQRSLMVHCPRCNGSMVKGDKICPICKTPMYSSMQKIQMSYFTPKMIVIYCIAASLSALAVFAILYPEKFAETRASLFNLVGQKK